MKSIRTFLSLLYLLLMVLLPWMHMPLHADVSEATTCASGCGHHETPADDSDEHDDCGLCNLAVVQAELPRVLLVPKALHVFSEGWKATPTSYSAQVSQPHQARAPPFRSV
ncbi:DUF2946 family protein [Pontiella desulfatans]|uniref:DUF2946 family protein n=1 Tax=Pontiella desulfatans TaxID=2750659 RepID=UPI0038B3FFB5